MIFIVLSFLRFRMGRHPAGHNPMPYLSRMLRKHAAPIHVSIRNPAFVRAPGFFSVLRKRKKQYYILMRNATKKLYLVYFLLNHLIFVSYGTALMGGRLKPLWRMKNEK